jgi:predicted unusual protein kinase regulating ubiquinone biosynthesis (AarF/ABC1/UbiB family)
VYRGTVVDGLGQRRPVAVKVMHPNVEDDIDADLDIMRVAVRLLEYGNVGPIRNMKWLNLPGFIEEMAVMLKIQLDLRTEGEHLVQFNKNFEGNDAVIFPNLVEGYTPTKHVLMETFCEGVPIMDFVRENKADRALLRHMCEGAVEAVCQMIFLGWSSYIVAIYTHTYIYALSNLFPFNHYFSLNCAVDNFTHG